MIKLIKTLIENNERMLVIAPSNIALNRATRNIVNNIDSDKRLAILETMKDMKVSKDIEEKELEQCIEIPCTLSCNSENYKVDYVLVPELNLTYPDFGELISRSFEAENGLIIQLAGNDYKKLVINALEKFSEYKEMNFKEARKLFFSNIGYVLLAEDNGCIFTIHKTTKYLNL